MATDAPVFVDDDGNAWPIVEDEAGNQYIDTGEGLIGADGTVYDYPEEQIDAEAWQAEQDTILEDLEEQRQYVERRLGRKLTSGEWETVVDTLEKQQELGQPFDVEKGLEAHYGVVTDEAAPDLETRQGRREYMADQIDQAERAQQETRESYDLDDRNQRREWMAARLDGRVGEEHPDEGQEQ